MLRFRQAADRLKKGLTVNLVIPFEVQNLLDHDINFLVKREDFEATIADLISRICVPVEQAPEPAGVAKDSLFAIEFHGGASRVAAVKAEIRQIFGRDPTQTLNPDECFALGGGFQAVIVHPHYHVKVNVTDVSQHRVNIEWFEEVGEDSPEVRFQFDARSRRIEREREKFVTQNINDRRPIGHAAGRQKISSLEFTFVKAKRWHIYQFHSLNLK
jgi:molecular chaperone DnaK (HSP70)